MPVVMMGLVNSVFSKGQRNIALRRSRAGIQSIGLYGFRWQSLRGDRGDVAGRSGVRVRLELTYGF